MLKWTSLIGLFAVAYMVAAQTGKAKRNVEVTAAEEKVRDAAGFEAIREIHREMDDDHSGSIDRKETTGFMSEDMNLRSSDRHRREKAFHGDDEAITVDDLWEAWFESDERSWNNEQVLNWIVNVVGIPVNVERLKRMNIDGTILPRLAVHNSTYMTQMLGIKSSVQRQRLRLNALDVVLFGYRGETGRVKDVALALLVLLLTSVIILYVKQRRRARTQLADLSHRMSQLKSMEADLELTQKSFNEERAKRSSCVGVSEDEMMTLKSQLAEAERRLEANTGYGAPLSLQPLLRRTCENELTYIDKQRSECISEMKEAIEMVERLRKKQTSVFTSIKLATGAASASDQVDSKIFALKSRMEKIHGLFRDTQARWQQIEALCGFAILASDELSMHSGASMTMHSSSAGQLASGYSSASSTSSRTSSNSNHSVDTRKPSTITQDKVNVAPTSSSSQLAKARSLENKENGVNNVPLVASPTLPKQQSAPVRTEDVSSMSSEVKKRKGLLGLFKKSSSKTSLQSQQSMH